MHGKDGVNFEILTTHGLDDFIHQLRIIKGAVVVNHERIAGIKQVVFGK